MSQAFPTMERGGGLDLADPGMSLRAYFASQAMQGLLANPGGPIQANGNSGWSFTNCDRNDVAILSVVMADALLAELAKAQAGDGEQGGKTNG